jgi:hypothetical protein
MYLYEHREYLVTIAIVTRKQVDKLKECINSFINNSDKSINNFEIIVKVDFDDYETIDFIREFNNENINMSFIINSRQKGYASLNEHHTDIFKMSRGKYVIGIGGDCNMLTKNWNSLLINYLTEFKFYFFNYQQTDENNIVTKLENIVNKVNIEDKPWVSVGKYYHDFVFYAVPRKLIELWGFISPHALTDNWLGEMAKRIGYHPWNEDFYEFIEDIEFNLPVELNPTPNPDRDQVFITYQYYVNDTIFFDFVNKLLEYKNSEKYNYYHKLNIINDWRNSGLSLNEYFDFK